MANFGPITLNISNLYNILNGGGIASIISSVVRPVYGIYSTNEVGGYNKALELSIVSVSVNTSAEVTTSPTEDGKYTSISKIQNPRTLEVVAVKGAATGFSGSIFNQDFELVSQTVLLQQLDDMLSETSTYTIETPKEIFENFDLIGRSYRVSAESGASLLTINLNFEEIRQDIVTSDFTRNSDGTITQNAQATTSPVSQKESKGFLERMVAATKNDAMTYKDKLESHFTKVSETVGKLFKDTSSSSDAVNESLSKKIGSLAQ